MVEKRFEKLGMPDIERFENYLPTAFNSELTLLQKVNKIIFDLMETNKLTNEMIDYLNKFIEKFDEKLYKTIEDVLQVWLEDGLLADVVREAINDEVVEARKSKTQTFNKLKTRLDFSDDVMNEYITKTDKKLKNIVNIFEFPVVGDGLTDDTIAIQQAINYCYANGLVLHFPRGTFRTKNLIFKVDMYGYGTTLLFDKDSYFTNFEISGSQRYNIQNLVGFIFESDKSFYWNSVNAGDSYDASVVKAEVKRKYGQRVFIGNKTTTPNNICANGETDRLNGTGFWNKDYNQWTSDSGLNLDSINTSFLALSERGNTNTLTLPHGGLIECQFIGFGVGLTLKGSYNVDVRRSRFVRCKVGLYTEHGASLPGSLSDFGAKCTTITISKCLFEDISFCGVYGSSLLQSVVSDSIMQPVKLGVVLLSSSENDIYNNYFEIVWSGLYIGTNDAKRNIFRQNFCNSVYTKYQVYARYGINNHFFLPKANPKHFAHSAINNCDFDFNCTVEMNTYFFYLNGNSIDRSKSKVAVFTTTGTGDNFTLGKESCSRQDGTLPLITSSQTGLKISGHEEILSVELLNEGIKVLSFYQVNTTGDINTLFVEEWDPSESIFKRYDLRVLERKATFRITFNDAYKV